MKRGAEEPPEPLCFEERLVLFKECYSLKTDDLKILINGDFFEKSEPSNEIERKNYYYYWDSLSSEVKIKRQKLEIIKMNRKLLEERELEIINMNRKLEERELDEKKKLAEEKKRELEEDKILAEEKKKHAKVLKKLMNNFLSSTDISNILICLSIENYAILYNRPTSPEIYAQFIENINQNFKYSAKYILERLNISTASPAPEGHPISALVDSDGTLLSPSSCTGQRNISAQKENRKNFFFKYPLDIKTVFPVVFSHNMFGQFLDIVNDNHAGNPILLEEFYAFLDKDVNFESLDQCFKSFMYAALSCTGKEIDLQNNILDALENIFERGDVHGTVTLDDTTMFKMDGMIVIKNLPFVIIEFKHLKYSIDAVIQALQYYSVLNRNHASSNFIDNFPAFIVTVDRGFMFVYGATTVNGTTLCDHLISIELTGCYSETNDSSTKFRRCIEALLFFYHKIMNRYLLSTSSNATTTTSTSTSTNTPSYIDTTDKKYKELENLMSSISSDVFFPSIFDVASFNDPRERIPIKFERKLYDKIFLVTNDENQKLILKITTSYCLDAHDFVAKLDLAPQIVGYETMYGNFHVVLMEFLDVSDGWVTLNKFHEIEEKYKSCSEYLTEELVIKPLKTFLERFNEEGKFVHGDFRDRNVMAKFNGEKKNFQFKIIDFDASGFINSRYPNLSFKNIDIKWPCNKFGSDAKRLVEHDTHMFEMLSNHFLDCIEKRKNAPKSESRSRSQPFV